MFQMYFNVLNVENCGIEDCTTSNTTSTTLLPHSATSTIRKPLQTGARPKQHKKTPKNQANKTRRIKNQSVKSLAKTFSQQCLVQPSTPMISGKILFVI